MRGRIEREKATIRTMVGLYCRKVEGNAELCESCRALLVYAEERLTHCPFGHEKPSCKQCLVHCYKPEMRKRIKEVMKSIGPKMMIYSPIKAMIYLMTR